MGSMRKILARRVSWVEAAATRRFYDGSASRCNPLFCNCNRLCLECQLEVDFFSQPGGGWVVELSCMVCVVGCYCVHISGSAEGRSSARHEFLNIYWAHGVVVSHPLRMRKALGSNPSVSIFCPCESFIVPSPSCPVSLVCFSHHFFYSNLSLPLSLDPHLSPSGSPHQSSSSSMGCWLGDNSRQQTRGSDMQHSELKCYSSSNCFHSSVG